MYVWAGTRNKINFAWPKLELCRAHVAQSVATEMIIDQRLVLNEHAYISTFFTSVLGKSVA